MALNLRTRNILISIPIVLAATYAALVGWFIVKEDSLAFLPRKGLRNADSLQLGIERVELTTPDNIELVAWVIPSVKPESVSVWFLYLHGNGGNISSRTYLSHYKSFRQLGINTFAIDYRGYGDSDGMPNEEGLYTDALTAFQYMTSERRIPSNKIFIFGYSLGSAIVYKRAGCRERMVSVSSRALYDEEQIRFDQQDRVGGRTEIVFPCES
jgi:pimeloyl-ACP methyl ester carboxylesterase